MGGKTGRAAKAGAKDWWGVKLVGQPTQFIFGYGSLINSASRHSSAGKTIPAIPVRISAAFGYIRTWNDRSASGFTALGLRKSGPDEKASTASFTPSTRMTSRSTTSARRATRGSKCPETISKPYLGNGCP